MNRRITSHLALEGGHGALPLGGRRPGHVWLSGGSAGELWAMEESDEQKASSEVVAGPPPSSYKEKGAKESIHHAQCK